MTKNSGYKKDESAVINYNQLKAARMIMVLSGVCGTKRTLRECLDNIIILAAQADKAEYEAEKLRADKKKRGGVSSVRADKGCVR